MSIIKRIQSLLTVAGGLLFGISGVCRPETDPRIAIQGAIQVNYSYYIPAAIVGEEVSAHYLHLDLTTLFPGTGLAGDIVLRNRTDDTLRLAAKDQTLMQFVSINYVRHDDSSQATVRLKSPLNEVIDYRMPKNLSAGNILPPHAQLIINSFPAWGDIQNIKPGVLDFYWSFDNSEAALKDTSVALVKYESRHLTVSFALPPANKVDSIYYLNQRAERHNSAEQFPQAYATCLQILQLDSLDISALSTATDVLWKMARFDEALSYARKCRDILQNLAQKYQAEKAIFGYDDVMPYLKRIKSFIEKCQKREKWKGDK